MSPSGGPLLAASHGPAGLAGRGIAARDTRFSYRARWWSSPRRGRQALPLTGARLVQADWCSPTVVKVLTGTGGWEHGRSLPRRAGAVRCLFAAPVVGGSTVARTAAGDKGQRVVPGGQVELGYN